MNKLPVPDTDLKWVGFFVRAGPEVIDSPLS